MNSETINLLAARAASILAQWAGLPSTRKHDNGDRSERGGLSMMLGVMTDRSEPLPSDGEERLRDALTAAITAESRERNGDVYIGLDVDYGPNRNLADLTERAGLRVTWPNKSGMTISAFADTTPTISAKQGYGARHVIHTLCNASDGSRGWLVSAFGVAAEILDVVVPVAIAGHPALAWEPVSA